MTIAWEIWHEPDDDRWHIQQRVNGKPVWYPPRTAYTKADAIAFRNAWEKQHDTLARITAH